MMHISDHSIALVENPAWLWDNNFRPSTPDDKG
jgi:hypothetical protein